MLSLKLNFKPTLKKPQQQEREGAALVLISRESRFKKYFISQQCKQDLGILRDGKVNRIYYKGTEDEVLKILESMAERKKGRIARFKVLNGSGGKSFGIQFKAFFEDNGEFVEVRRIIKPCL